MWSLNPATNAAALVRYAHGVKVPASARIIRTSGQLGLADEGSVPASVKNQVAVTYANARAIWAEGGRGAEDICQVSTWLNDCADLPEFLASAHPFCREQ